MPAVEGQHDAIGRTRFVELVELAETFECVRQRVLHLRAVTTKAPHRLGKLFAERPIFLAGGGAIAGVLSAELRLD